MKEGKTVKFNLHSHQQQQQHANGGHLSPFKFAKLLDPDASWDKDQLGDVLHWIRQVVALVCGLLWGSIPLVGGIWIVILTKKILAVMELSFKRGFLLLPLFFCWYGF
ncbi:respirasome complex assembly factor 1 [Citrus sinensis]|uniref:Respirasome complex assembly factor 1 n=1 Tax=Citrus sinensis TaxID=2711 RepID=A0ACB8IW23_CITSI|nr:respirasome complex assembly factor 1 [Citrus sinensis]KAH9701302.1 respirasome complex assembly factor 1 [Citrus sinensis]